MKSLLSYPLLKNLLSRRMPCVKYVPVYENLALCKGNTDIALEPPSALGLYRPTQLASTSYSVSLCCLDICISEGDDTEQLGGFFVHVDY